MRGCVDVFCNVLHKYRKFFVNYYNFSKLAQYLWDMGSRNQTSLTIDHATGELVREEKIYTSKYKTKPFVSVSLPVPDMLHQVLNKDGRVLLALAELAEFNTNAVFLIASRRQQIMARAGVSSAQLSNVLRRLREAGVILGDKGEAIIHPSVLWKGETVKKNEMLAELGKKVESKFEGD